MPRKVSSGEEKKNLSKYFFSTWKRAAAKRDLGVWKEEEGIKIKSKAKKISNLDS